MPWFHSLRRIYIAQSDKQEGSKVKSSILRPGFSAKGGV